MTDRGRKLRKAAERLGTHQTTRVLLAAAARGLGAGLAWLALLLAFDLLASLPAAAITEHTARTAAGTWPR